MARLMPLLLAASSAQDIKHVLAGQEYTSQLGRNSKSISSNQFGSSISEDQFVSCQDQGSDSRSLHDFTTEDIEKLNNVSFSQPKYTNKVLLVVNLASF